MNNDKTEIKEEGKFYISIYLDGNLKEQRIIADNTIEIFVGDDPNSITRIFYLQIERNNKGKIKLWVDHKKVGELKEVKNE